MKKKFKNLKRVVSFLLALVITATSLLSSDFNTVVADSDAKQRVINFISLAAGKQNQDLESALNLTTDELRFLGVYLSNFYIPFGTELGVTDSEVAESEKKEMVEALANGLKFNEDMSSILVETVMGLSRSNTKQLEFRVSKEWHKGYEKIDKFDLNYYTFLQLMSGRSIKKYQFGAFVDQFYDISEGDGGELKFSNKYHYGYFGFEENGEFVPMFDCGVDGQHITPSMVAFSQCINSIDWKNGYGINFFDFNKEEQKDLDSVYDSISDMSDDLVYKLSAYGAKMNVDCFGNIIVMGGNHQYVVVPGAMNPYTWVSVDSSGNDLMSAGNYYNIITFQGMSLADKGNLIAKRLEFKNKSGSKDVKDMLDSLVPEEATAGKTYSNSKDPNALWFYYKSIDDWASSWEKVKESKSTKIGTLSWLSPVLATYFTGGDVPDFLSKVEGVPMRVTRGSGNYKFDDSIFWGGQGIELVKKAEEGAKAEGAGLWYWGGSEGGLTELTIPVTDWKLNDYILLLTPVKNNSLEGMGEIKAINKMAYIDNLGVFGFDDAEKQIDYNAINFETYIDEKGKSAKQLFKAWSEDPNNGFTNLYKNIQEGKVNTKVNADAAAVVSVYTTYAIAGLYQDSAEAKKETIGKLGYRINKDGLVAISADPLDLPNSISEDLMTNAIRDWIYYLLHPTKGFDYVRILITNKLNALLVGWHNDMVGTDGVGAITGTTRFRNNVGYVTTPDLSEIEWTASLIKIYNNAIPFLIVIMIVTMLFAFITGIMSIQRCLLSVLIFSCFLLVPVNAINGVVGLSNRVSQNLYGEKFSYWALIQQESYTSKIDEAASGESYSNYLKTLYANNNAVYSNQGSDSIVLKWQAPKKLASLMLSESDGNILNSLSNSKLIGYVLNRNTFSGETYVDGDNDYMYRSYIDLGNFSRYIYNGLNMGTQSSKSHITSDLISNTDKSFKKSINSMSANFSLDRTKGYTNKNKGGNSDTSKALRLTLPLTSRIYNDALSMKGKVTGMSMKDFVGIRQDVFNFSIAMFNNSSEKYKDNLLANCSEECKDDLKKFLKKYSDEDLSGLAAYSLMSESPYYYFSWGLYDYGMSTTANATNGYKSLLLGQDEGGFFYNTKNNGELKDFMDMKTLFTYVIPYLRQGNDIVREWDEIYGTEVYDGVPTDEGHWNDPDIKGNSELKQKYWHNLNVARLYEIYTPWVDLMYDCSYAKPEIIEVFGEKVTIEDPINPSSYPKDRPMVFSESEMYDYGLEETDLTKVERLIINFNQGAESRMYELLNYYNFSDATLNSAAAIACTFEFNVTFSEGGLFKDNINLYPQSFEIADFSYDAFLRFILSNSTNIDMTGKQDFYMSIVEQSSTTTAIVMLVLDILSQYVLPAFKLFFLIAVFISVILLVVATAFKIDPEQKFIKVLAKGILIPMISFLVINVAFSAIVSLFMGVGNNKVTETQTTSISMGDPVTAMLALAALDIIVVVLYFKILKGVIKDIKHNFKAVSNFMGGVFGGALVAAGGLVAGSEGSKRKFGIGRSSDRRNKSQGFGSGTGRESGRASKRASENSAQGKNENIFDRSNRRMNETKRSTVSEPKDLLRDEKTEKIKKEDLNSKTKSGIFKMQNTQNNRTRDTSNKVKDSGTIKK